ncbi:hypothetical protein [Roseateles sp. LYH14W]|uniref:Sulfatase n=1 Tax=Pelomonas parva TaxID=3299032 RepID=A0ABW7FCP7_9BURK
MHESESPPSNQIGAARQRPLWMLALLAFGLGPLLFRLLFDSQLAAASTWLVAALDIGFHRSDIHLTRLLLRVALPTLLVLALLRFTPLGRWIVMTPAALALLLIENAFFGLYVFNQVSVYVLNDDGLLRQLVKGPAQPIALVCVSGATLLLLCATAWHRSSAFKRWLTSSGQSWLRPL